MHSGKPWAASDLVMTTHFEVQSTYSKLIENFLGGIIAEALMSSDDILYLPDDSTMHVIYIPFPQQPGCTKT